MLRLMRARGVLMGKSISFEAMISSKSLDSFNKICCCPNCGADIMSDHICEEMSTVAVCPTCDLKIYVGGC
jgi:predicted RNA-binding Zn-ribbon protein involved in translation (DUF1610 family)